MAAVSLQETLVRSTFFFQPEKKIWERHGGRFLVALIHLFLHLLVVWEVVRIISFPF